MPPVPDTRFGLFLNLGGNLAPDDKGVVQFTLEQARLAEACGYDDLWVTEHHFINFGVNPAGLVMSSYLLGATERIRVGTAVVLSPLYPPEQIAEQTALLDQLSGGRFDLGLGRGGYLKEYDVYGIPTSRWDDEPVRTAQTLIDLWQSGPADQDLRVRPDPLSGPMPPLLLATASDDGIAMAARHGLALQHYFATPLSNRIEFEHKYTALQPDGAAPVDHLHTLIGIVTDEEQRDREWLSRSLAQSFADGRQPHVPQMVDRHPKGPDGNPLSAEAMAEFVAQAALIGPPAKMIEELNGFIEQTGARRIALYMEACADRDLTMRSIHRFATEVRPHLGHDAHQALA